MKKLLMALLIGVFLISSVSAACTVTLDKDSYVAGETATASMICTTNPEKNTAYTLNWTYQNGTQVETDTGTTPNIVNQLFYQSYTIPSTWPNSVWLNASLFGTGLSVTQNDSANVTSTGGASTLQITNATFGGGYLGLVSSIKAIVKDENGKKISGGNCEIIALSNDETSVLLQGTTHPIDGDLEISDILSPTRFNEGTDYSYHIHCYCGSAGGATECVDEDGINVNNSIGSTTNFFTTKTYLTVNTITDKSTYDMRNFISICANTTNIDYSERIPLQIDYQARCSVGDDNNSDLDRSLIFSDGEGYDKRGISANTTQMQCKRFIIPEIREYEGTFSTCYASTNVWIIGEDGNKLLVYPTTSNMFYINSTELNLKVDWAQTSNLTFNSIINMSSEDFQDWNGTNTGNIDIRLISPDETLDPDLRKVIQAVDLNNFLTSEYINSITVTNLSGDNVTPYLEFTDDGNLEIKLRDQYLGKTGWYNVTIVFNNYDERQAVALEGINNKTGTFHLDVDCPAEGIISNDMTCTITAYVEDSQIMEKEVDFTCYITDGIFTYSSTNFNQMITRNAASFQKDFSVPSSFNSGQQYVLQCTADYYNLGSRRDSFYDTFIANTATGGGGSVSGEEGEGAPITGGATGGGTKPIDWGEIFPFGPEAKVPVIFIASVAGLALLILILRLILRKRKPHHLSYKSEKIFSTILKIIAFLFVLTAVGIILYYSAGLATKILSLSWLQDSLIRGMILIAFIIFMIIILFRALNLQGEIKFGGKRFSNDTKVTRLQNKINRRVLKDELRRVKHRR